MGIPLPSLNEFYSIVTNKKIYSPSTLPAVAITQIEYWMESPKLQILQEPPSFMSMWINKLKNENIHGALVHDLKILLICEINNVSELFTMDRDFFKFKTNLKISSL